MLRWVITAYLVLTAPHAFAAPEDSPKTITLQQAFDDARSSSVELQSARQRIVTAEINVARAWALLKPTWDATLTYTHLEPSPNPGDPLVVPDLQGVVNSQCSAFLDTGGLDALNTCIDSVLRELGNPTGRLDFGFDFARKDTYTLNTRIQWTPFNGRAWPLIDNAEDGVVLEKQRLIATESTQLLAVARAYYAAVATSDAIGAAERAKSRADQRFQTSQSRAALGQEAPTRLKATRIAAEQASLDVERARNTHAQTLIGLAFIIGRDDAIDVSRPPPPTAPVESTPVLVREAITQRHDLVAARMGVAIAERGKTAALWRFAPTMSLFSSFRQSNVQGIVGRNFQWTIGVVANLVLYDAGLRYQELQDSDVRIKTARLAVQRAENAVRRDIKRARLRMKAARIARARGEQTLELANERVKITNARLSAGTATEIQLSEAYDAVADAELLIIRAELDHALAVLELRHAAGRFP